MRWMCHGGLGLVLWGCAFHGFALAEAPSRIAALRTELSYHDELYFRKSAPAISDAAYDQLKQELERLEQADSSKVRESFPRISLGDDRTGVLPTYRHRERMLSLDKGCSEADLQSFYSKMTKIAGDRGVTCVVEPKYDGLAISVTYEDGVLIHATTRGNGEEGDDVTTNALALPTLPRRLRSVAADGTVNPIPSLVELRGEVYLPLPEFERLNHERELAGEPRYAHPRNVAAATLRQQNTGAVAQRRLAVVFYGWGACAPESDRPGSQRAFHHLVKQWGLPGVERFHVVSTAEEAWASVQAFQGYRQSLKAPTDGVVVKLDATASQLVAGVTAQAPRWAMAIKYPALRSETRVEAITLQVGRTGVITPVAEITSVEIDGAKIARATLHNRREIARQDIRVGDWVYVQRAREVIPDVVGVNLARRPPDSEIFTFPSDCPVCRSRLTQRTDEVAVRCPNYDCPGQLKRRLEHFGSEACVDIAGLGPEMIDALVREGGVRGIPDLYRFKRGGTVMGAPSLVSGQAGARLQEAMEQSKRAELWRFICGLGIPHVGPVTAQDLAGRFDGLKELMAACTHPDVQVKEVTMRDLSPTVVKSLATYFSEPRNRELITELIALGVQPTSRPSRKTAATRATFLGAKVDRANAHAQGLSGP